GVELAGQVAILARRVLRGEYRHIDPRHARVVLIDAVAEVLSALPRTLSEHGRRALEGLGVEVELDARVVGVDRGGVEIEDAGGQHRRLEARTVIWAAGVRASPLAALLARASGAGLDGSGRLELDASLTLPGHAEVFVIGDMATLPGVPGTAQPAIQQGKYAASVILARLAGRSGPTAFRYRDLGTMATIGRTKAVADLFGRVRIWGFPAFVVWGVVHLAYLVGWGNRFEAVARWMWTLLARNRRERLISVVSLASDEAGREQLAVLRGSPRPSARRRQAAGAADQQRKR
ncbi:MAG TPA: FAD-dependent oxidoreductase, partial [Solirubrobacteraceae bacterium]|nr:FAD-dependent oxidoreductase [Solirubrobacteraceae bacterium]